MSTVILYVDDESINLLNMKLSLDEEFDLHTAASGERALDVIESVDVRIVLTDQKMRGMTGVELAKAIRDRGRMLPVIIVTGYINDEAVNAAVESGLIQEVIHKPFSHEQFMETIRRHVH